MAAEIRSSIPAKPILDGVSRDDLALADVITVEQTPPVVGTTWAWTLVYVPEGSGAALTPPAAVTTSGPMSFTADRVGSYLVRLVVDAGLPTESTQYVRLRALTASLGLKLVAAGERRDATGVIPVDVDIEGWANEQNFNLLALETAAATDPLADVLVVGNTTGGTNILMTTGDKIVGQTHVEIDSTGAGTNIVLNPDAAGSVVVNGKLTVTGLIDPTGVIFDEAAAPTVAANKGGLFVSDGTGALTQNHLYYQPTGAGAPVDLSHAATGGETLAVTLGLGNTTGGTNIQVSAGDSIIDQTEIVLDEAAAPTVAANKGGLFVSDGTGALVANHLYYQPTGAGSPVDLSHAATGGETLAVTLGLGNTTGGTNIQVSAGDSITGQTEVVLDEAAAPTVAANKGGLFVSDGTGALVANHLYYKPTGAGSPVDLTVGSGTLQDAYNAGNTITTSGGNHVQITASIAGGGFLVDGIAPAGTEGFVGFGAGTALLALTGDAKGIAFNATEVASFQGGTTTDIRLAANDNAARTLLVNAENAGAGTANLTIDAEDQITVGGTNTAAPKIQVAGGVDQEILSLSQTTGEAFGLFAGSADPNGTVSASAGSLFVRDTGAGASLHQNRSAGTGTVWADLSGAGQVVSDFIFQPGGTATENVYTDFNTLYTALNASTAPKKRLILDDSVTSPIPFPAGTFDLAGVTLTNRQVSDQTDFARTHIHNGTTGWNAATVFQNVARIEGLQALVPVAGAGTPFTFTTDSVVYMENCWWAQIAATGDPFFSVSGGSIVTFHCTDTKVGDNTGAVVSGSGTDTISFTLRGTSSIGPASLKSAGGDTVSGVDLSPGSSFDAAQPHWSGGAIPAFTSPAGTVGFDPTSMTVAVGTDVQTAIGQLDAASGISKLIPYRLKMEIDSGYLAIETHLGWAPTACVLDGVRVYMGTVNTSASTYTLDVKKGGTSCLSGGTTFDMNTLVATTVTDVPLGGVVARTFAAQDVWTIDMAASDAAFNGADIYIQIVFRVS